MKINRGTLLQALEFVSPGLSSREILEQSNSYVFKNKKIFTFDDETLVIVDSPLDITGAIPAEPLRDILHRLKEEHLEITQEPTKLVIKGKGQTVRITMDKKIELPIDSLETPSKWKALPERFSEGLKLVESCACRDESQFALTCIHLHPNHIEAFDTYQFARFKIDLGIKEATLVRQISLKNIIDLEMNEFAQTDQWLHFRNSAGLTLACRRYTDKYPKLDAIAGVSGKKIQLPKNLSEVAERAEVFSTYNVEENNIRVDLKPGWVIVKGEGQYGDYRAIRKIKYSGGPLSFLLHPQMLAQIVKNHSECMICTDKIKALKAELGDFVFVASLSEPNKKVVKPEKKTIKKKVKI